MSNDLISRSALLEDFRRTITEQSDTMDWLNMIARQPTAYDVDKVAEKIIKARDNECASAVPEIRICDAIKIVREGVENG